MREIVLINITGEDRPGLTAAITGVLLQGGVANIVSTTPEDAAKDFLEGLKNREEVMEHIEDILFRSCDIKREVVEEDEKEHGLRMILNFGHTVGHGLEQYYNYEKYTHGEAVSLGMIEILETGEREGITEKGTLERTKKLLMQLNLPVEDKYNREDVIKIMKRDKKNKKGEVNFVMIEKIGKHKIVKIKYKLNCLEKTRYKWYNERKLTAR